MCLPSPHPNQTHPLHTPSSLPTYVCGSICLLSIDTLRSVCQERCTSLPPCTSPEKKLCCVNVRCSRALEAKKLSRSECVSPIRATYDTKHEDRIALLFHLSPPPPPPSRSGAIHTAPPPPSPLTLVGRGARGEERKSPVSRRVYLIIYFPSLFRLPPPLLPWSRERKGGRVGGGRRKRYPELPPSLLLP